MKLAATIARYLMGVICTIFGLNGFLHFIPAPPPPESLAVQYVTVLTDSHYLVLVFILQLVGGLLLLSNRFVPLALAVLAPIIVNILMFHLLMNPEGIGPGLLVAVSWAILFTRYRDAFAGIFHPGYRVTEQPLPVSRARV
jgi:putative oxidoreductase